MQEYFPGAPPPAVIKLNVDASFCKDTGQACVAVIGRNRNGNIHIGLTKKTFANSPLSAEALAVREAASLAVNLGLQNILIESDCLVLVTACRKETEIGEISSIVQDILQLKQNVRNCGFTWVGRSGNKLAHTLAKMAHRDSLPTNWRWNLPLQLKLIVDLEARHIEHRDGPFIRQQNPTNGLSSTCGIS